MNQRFECKDPEGDWIKDQKERWGALPLGELTPDDELELRAMVGNAFTYRDQPHLFRLYCDQIANWFDCRHIREHQRRERSTAAVLQCLKETQ